jgi:tRNA threonylcarbamoyladenosine biosynthesis protein TsaE
MCYHFITINDIGSPPRFAIVYCMTNLLTIDVPKLDATMAFGRCLALQLFPGAVIALVGPLGAGKTQLVRAVAEGLGIADSRAVSSPTFVLIQEYDARLPIYHFDAYRLRTVAEFFDLGVHEYFEGKGVCLVEWADRVVSCLPDQFLKITLVPTGETTRRIIVESYGATYAPVVQALCAAFPPCSPASGERS